MNDVWICDDFLLHFPVYVLSAAYSTIVVMNEGDTPETAYLPIFTERAIAERAAAEIGPHCQVGRLPDAKTMFSIVEVVEPDLLGIDPEEGRPTALVSKFEALSRLREAS